MFCTLTSCMTAGCATVASKGSMSVLACTYKWHGWCTLVWVQPNAISFSLFFKWHHMTSQGHQNELVCLYFVLFWQPVLCMHWSLMNLLTWRAAPSCLFLRRRSVIVHCSADNAGHDNRHCHRRHPRRCCHHHLPQLWHCYHFVALFSDFLYLNVAGIKLFSWPVMADSMCTVVCVCMHKSLNPLSSGWNMSFTMSTSPVLCFADYQKWQRAMPLAEQWVYLCGGGYSFFQLFAKFLCVLSIAAQCWPANAICSCVHAAWILQCSSWRYQVVFCVAMAIICLTIPGCTGCVWSHLFR